MMANLGTKPNKWKQQEYQNSKPSLNLSALVNFWDIRFTHNHAICTNNNVHGTSKLVSCQSSISKISHDFNTSTHEVNTY